VSNCKDHDVFTVRLNRTSLGKRILRQKDDTVNAVERLNSISYKIRQLYFSFGRQGHGAGLVHATLTIQRS
jgi:uncharacterized protein with GYD domain